jgi:H+/Cl- antiporter ClcA
MEFTKEYFLNCVNRTGRYAKTFIKWLICAAIIGTTCGAVGTLFHYSVEYVTDFRSENFWIIGLLPFAGLIIVFIYRISGIKHDKGTNLVISSIRTPEDRIPFKVAPLIFIATVITHLFGGSAGREGAALQIGGGIGAGIGKLFHMDENDKHIIILCGMSAVFAALFGTPITAALFSMEVISIGVLYYSALVPCLLSSTIAYTITERFHVTPTAFVLQQVPDISILTGIRVIILAILCAILSIIFCMVMQASSKFFKHFFKNQYVRIFVGGVILVLLTLAVRTTTYNGAGMDTITKAIHGSANSYDFALKILFTCITISCGFRGGEIVPSFFIGSTFGCFVGKLIGLDPGFGAAIGLVCFFCGVVNCPLTSIVLSIELFGASGVLLFAIGCGVSYMLSGYYSLYSEQKIIYSKLRPHYVNLYTNQEVRTKEHDIE